MDSLSDDSIINYSDPEYRDPIKETLGGRKRNILNKRNQKQIMNNTLPNNYSLNCPHVEIGENSNTFGICSISLLTHEDIMTFKKHLCSLPSKINQDKFVLTMMKVRNAKRTKRKNTLRSDRVTTKYFIPNLSGDMLNACAQAFSDVTSIKRRRLNLISKHFHVNHTSPKENRGGKYPNASEIEVTLSIENHIKSFKWRKSHHTRRETGRSYLQPELSIKAMWTHWKMNRLKEHCCIASYYINHKTTIFKEIKHIFPVRGHCYMPPDRVFGRIKQVLRKKESILSPSQYHDIFKQFCSVKVYGKDFTMCDYKYAAKKIVKTKTDFKSTEQKIYTYTKGERTVGISKTYGGIPTKIEVIKRNKSLSTFYTNLVQLPKTNHVKIPKQNDVKNLLKYFAIPEDYKIL